MYLRANAKPGSGDVNAEAVRPRRRWCVERCRPLRVPETRFYIPNRVSGTHTLIRFPRSRIPNCTVRLTTSDTFGVSRLGESARLRGLRHRGGGNGDRSSHRSCFHGHRERLGTEGRFADVEWRATQHRLASKNIAQNSSQTPLAKRLRMGEPPPSLRAGTSSHCFCTSLLSCEGTTRGRREELLNIAAPSTLLL
jgi:hypothetical protein